jgi:hypothetical protein
MIPAGCIIVGCWAGYESTGNLNLAKAVNFGIFLTDFGFSGIMNTFGPAYGAEIMTTNIRSAGVAVGYFVFNCLIIVHTQTATLAIAAIAWRYFLIFLILDCVYVVLVYFFYPETKVSCALLYRLMCWTDFFRVKRLKRSPASLAPSLRKPGTRQRSNTRLSTMNLDSTVQHTELQRSRKIQRRAFSYVRSSLCFRLSLSLGKSQCKRYVSQQTNLCLASGTSHPY